MDLRDGTLTLELLAIWPDPTAHHRFSVRKLTIALRFRYDIHRMPLVLGFGTEESKVHGSVGTRRPFVPAGGRVDVEGDELDVGS